MSQNELTPDTEFEVVNPKISWSMILMGVGVVASVVFNYAAYGTRIAVVEANVVTQDKSIEQLTQQLNTAIDLLHKVHVNSEADKRDIEFLAREVKRLQDDVQDIKKGSK